MPLFPGRLIRKPVSLHLEVHPDNRNKLFSQLLPCPVCFGHKGGHAAWGWKKTILWVWSKKLWDYKWINLFRKNIFKSNQKNWFCLNLKCNSPTFNSLVHCRDKTSLNILQNFSFCVSQKKRSHTGLEKTRRWVTDNRIIIFGWIIPESHFGGQPCSDLDLNKVFINLYIVIKDTISILMNAFLQIFINTCVAKV